MAFRRTRRPAFRRGPRKTYEWCHYEYSENLNANTIGTAGAPLSGFESAIGADIIGWRIERILINGLVALTAGSAAEATPAPSWQAYLYIDNGTATSSIGNGPWRGNTLWLRSGHLYAASALNTGNAPGPSGMERFSLDLKSRRRFREYDDVLRLFTANTTATDDEVYINLAMDFLLSKV